MRRPLRFLTHKLDLDDTQVPKLAEILADLNTERAALDVALQRAQKRYADSLKGDVFDADLANRANQAAVDAHAERQKSVSDALSRLHELLEPEQRAILAGIVRIDFFLG